MKRTPTCEACFDFCSVDIPHPFPYLRNWLCNLRSSYLVRDADRRSIHCWDWSSWPYVWNTLHRRNRRHPTSPRALYWNHICKFRHCYDMRPAAGRCIDTARFVALGRSTSTFRRVQTNGVGILYQPTFGRDHYRSFDVHVPSTRPSGGE